MTVDGAGTGAGDRPGRDTPVEPDPLAEWAAAYDDALRRGETPPSPKREAEERGGGDEPERLRDLLHMLHHALRAPLTGGGEARGQAPVGGEETFPPLGRFVVERELGRGGFGVVYLAYDPAMERRVALKVPCADALLAPGLRRRFLREARAAARLDHPNLVPMYEAGEIGPLCYIASAYCEGPTLAQWLAAQPGPVDPRPAARLARTLALAVAHIHERGLVHGDLKPGNILLDPPPRPGDDPVPRITDFGLARLIDATPNMTSVRPMGTPPYMAPEQIEPHNQPLGPPADVYALGAILYELLTGRPPHDQGSEWRTMRAVMLDPPVPPRQVRPGLPRDLESICLKCLEKLPSARYAGAGALAEDLGRYLANQSTRARPVGTVQRAVRWCHRHPTAAAIAGMGVVTLALTLAYAVSLERSNRRLTQADHATRQALDVARRQRYVATLALAQQDIRSGRLSLAQRRLRSLIPAPGEPEERDFAWYYLYRQTRDERTTLGEVITGQTAHVSAARGLLLAVSAKLGCWDFELPGSASLAADRTARPLFRFRHGFGTIRPWHSGAVSPDGRLVIVNQHDDAGERSLAVLDPRSGQVRAKLGWPELKQGSEFAFDNDRHRVAVGIEPPRPEAMSRLARRRIDVGASEPLEVIGVPRSDRSGFSSDGRRLFALRWSEPPLDARRLEAWDVSSGRLAWSREDEVVGQALAVSTRPGGPVVTGSLDGRIQVRNSSDGTVLSTWRGHTSPVHTLAFSPDGALLVSGSNRHAWLWDVARGTLIRVLNDLADWVNSIAFLPGTDDVALGLGRGQVVIWHGRPLTDRTFENAHGDEVWGVAYSPDGRLLASVGGDSLVRLRDAASGAVVRTLHGRDEWPERLAFSPDGRVLVVSDLGGYLQVWDPRTGQLLRTFQAHATRVRALAFSSDSRWLATGGGQSRDIHLWDTAQWQRLASFAGHAKDIRALAFSPDGRTLASASDDTSVALRDVATGQVRARWYSTAATTCVAFSPDGSVLAWGDNLGGVVLHDLRTSTDRARLADLHAEETSDLAFSPDGRILAVASQDRVVSLVDVPTGQPHLTLLGHTGGVNRVAFSPDGQTLASASHDRSVRLWWAGPGGAISTGK